MKNYDVAVIGGGLSGLAAATIIAKAGKKVVLFEKGKRLGGRAITNIKNGVSMNLGARGLFIQGEAIKIYRELGMNIPGNKIPTKMKGIWKGSIVRVPTDVFSIITNPLLTWKGKIQYAKLMLKIMKMNIEEIGAISLKDWIEQEISDPMVKQIFYGICRLNTYNNAPELQLAKPVLHHVQLTINGGTVYVDYGWGTIVQQLEEIALENGVEIVCNKNIVQVNHSNTGQTLCFSNEEQITVRHCILAVSVQEAEKILRRDAKKTLQAWQNQALPVVASSLDLALKRLPHVANALVVGLDEPIFFTNQSRSAVFGEDGTQVVTLTKYHHPFTSKIDSKLEKESLEAFMDIIQPGWREEVVAEQFLPKITVCNDFPHIYRNKRPSIAINGLYFAGDWVLNDELLSDGAVKSGKEAALQLLEELESERINIDGPSILSNV